MKHIKVLLFFFTGLFYLQATAQEVIKVNAGEKLTIGKSIAYFIDTTSRLSLDQVLSKPFVKSKTDILNFGNMPHNVWLKFTVESETEAEIYLELVEPLLAELEVYQSTDSNTLQLFTGGFLRSFNERPVALENWVFPLKLARSKPATIVIKGKSLFPFLIPVTVSAKDRFVEDTQQHSLFWGAYMGIMIFAFIYNLFLFFSLRERTYLYYLLYVLGSSLFYLGLQGFNFQFLWPDKPVLNTFIPVLICMTNVVITLFAMRFLHIDKRQKFQYYTGYALMGAFILIALVNFTGKYEIAIGLAQLFSLFISLYLIGIGFVSLKRGVPTARFFLIGWLMFLALVIVYILALNNVVPNNFFTTHCIFIGHVSEVMLLSFALADRINYLKHENETKQKEIIRYLKENEEIQLKANAELEQKVKERTAELVENQNKLIESEKMAAIGVLASRIAHEIQNPLNFVNNFSEVSIDLADELEGQLAEKDDTEAIDLLKMNLKKINEHGKSASSIINVLHEHLRLGTAADYFYNDKK